MDCDKVCLNRDEKDKMVRKLGMVQESCSSFWFWLLLSICLLQNKIVFLFFQPCCATLGYKFSRK